MTRFPQFIGGFEILGSLGQGGMGIVYCARDNTLQRELAIKLQSGDWQSHPERLQRFLREAQVLARINHPNVVQIYSVGEHEGAPFFVMELLEGSVADAARLRMPAIAQVKRWMLEAARGLAAIHETGVIHRDIKPGNLLLTRATSVETEHVKVADLGIASTGDQFGAPLTRAGAVLGTSGYLPPESFRMEHTLDSRADQYSLGVVFFELLARRPPYQDMGDIALLAAILEPRAPPDVREFRPEVDSATAEILTRMLQDDPDRRFEHTAALVQALMQVQDAPSLPRVATASAADADPLRRSSGASVAPPSPPPLAAGPTRPAAVTAVPPPPPLAPAAATLQRTAVAARAGLAPATLAALLGVALLLAAAGFYLWTRPPAAATEGVSQPAVTTATPAAPPPEVVDPGAVPDARSVDPLQREAWAKYLLGRYRLHGDGQTEDWTLDLLEQESGVIDAELDGPDDEPIELSGRVESHALETVDGEDWEVYRVKLLGPADTVLEMRVLFSEDATVGEGTVVYYGERERFQIKDSVDL